MPTIKSRFTTIMSLALAVTAFGQLATVGSAEAAGPQSPLKLFGLRHKLTGKERGSFPTPPRIPHGGPRDSEPPRVSRRQLRVVKAHAKRIPSILRGPRRHIENNEGGYSYEVNRGLAWVNYYYSQVISGYVAPDVVWGGERYNLYCGSVVGNAYSCATGKDAYGRQRSFITWDSNFFLGFLGKPSYGDMAVSWILAHEWGHSMQTLLNVPYATSWGKEVGADCLAGAWWRYMNSVGRLDNIAPGDGYEAQNAIYALRDDRWNRRTVGDGHGNYQERWDWTMYGYNYGPAACFNGSRNR